MGRRINSLPRRTRICLLLAMLSATMLVPSLPSHVDFGCISASGSCFIAGTLVQMWDHPAKPIEQVQTNDLVASENPLTGKIEAKRVISPVVKHAAELVALTVAESANGKAVETITCTPEHPFYASGKGFVAAGELGIGTQIVTRAGPTLWVTGTARSKPAGGVTVYNLVVADDHTYFVGAACGGAWVHNDNCGPDYRKVFFGAHPNLNPEEWQVHHAIPQHAFEIYPNELNPDDMNAIENLRGIRKGDSNIIAKDVHQKDIGRLWIRFYRENPKANLSQIEKMRDLIDTVHFSNLAP